MSKLSALTRLPLQAIRGEANVFPIEKDLLESLSLGLFISSSLWYRRFWRSKGGKDGSQSLGFGIGGRLRRRIRFGAVGIMVNGQGSRLNTGRSRHDKGMTRCHGTKEEERGGFSTLHDRNQWLVVIGWEEAQSQSTCSSLWKNNKEETFFPCNVSFKPRRFAETSADLSDKRHSLPSSDHALAQSPVIRRTIFPRSFPNTTIYHYNT